MLTGEDGGVSLRVPLPAGPSVTVVASKDGYVSTQLPCITDRSPGQIRNVCETLSTAQTKLRLVKIHFNMTSAARSFTHSCAAALKKKSSIDFKTLWLFVCFLFFAQPLFSSTDRVSIRILTDQTFGLFASFASVFVADAVAAPSESGQHLVLQPFGSDHRHRIW